MVFCLVSSVPGSASRPQEAARLNNIGVAYMNRSCSEGLKAFEGAAEDPNLKVKSSSRRGPLIYSASTKRKLYYRSFAGRSERSASLYNLGLITKIPTARVCRSTRFVALPNSIPTTPMPWYFLGSKYSQLKQYPEAIEAFETR